VYRGKYISGRREETEEYKCNGYPIVCYTVIPPPVLVSRPTRTRIIMMILWCSSSLSPYANNYYYYATVKTKTHEHKTLGHIRLNTKWFMYSCTCIIIYYIINAYIIILYYVYGKATPTVLYDIIRCYSKQPDVLPDSVMSQSA